MCRHAVVTFLNSPQEIRCVDPGFRPLVRALHTIPFCASFGVSCAGHLNAETNRGTFRPQLNAHLNIAMVPEFAHVARLRDLIGRTVSETPDATFQQIKHFFGPPMGYPIQVWEIGMGDNGCLAPLGDYWGEYLNISANRTVFEAAAHRYAEIDRLWVRLTQEVRQFCRMNGFGKFDLNRRVRELVRVWNMAIREAKRAMPIGA